MSDIYIFEGFKGAGKSTAIKNFRKDNNLPDVRINNFKVFSNSYSLENFYSIKCLKKSQQAVAILRLLETDLNISLEFIRQAHEGRKKGITSLFDRLFLSPLCLYDAYFHYFKLNGVESISSMCDLYCNVLEYYDIKWKIYLDIKENRKISYDLTGKITEKFHDNYSYYMTRMGLYN